MKRRLLRLAYLAAALPLASFKLGVPVAPAPVTVGALAPAPILDGGEPDGLIVAWTFPTESLLSCSSPASEFRRLQRVYGNRVRLVAVAVGDDPNILEPFLVRQVIRPEIRRMTSDDYVRHFGTTPLPAVHIIKDRVVRETVSDSTWADGESISRRGIKQTAEAFLD